MQCTYNFPGCPSSRMLFRVHSRSAPAGGGMPARIVSGPGVTSPPWRTTTKCMFPVAKPHGNTILQPNGHVISAACRFAPKPASTDRVLCYLPTQAANGSITVYLVIVRLSSKNRNKRWICLNRDAFALQVHSFLRGCTYVLRHIPVQAKVPVWQPALKPGRVILSYPTHVPFGRIRIEDDDSSGASADESTRKIPMLRQMSEPEFASAPGPCEARDCC